MGVVSDNLGILYLGVAAGVYFKPEYTIHNSRLLTLVVLFTIVTVSKVIYQLVLYPALFTPLKHIQTPAVSQPSSPIIRCLTGLETELAKWEYKLPLSGDSTQGAQKMGQGSA